VVRAENSGVGGGAAGEDWGLVAIGLIEMVLNAMGLIVLDADGRMNEDSVEDGAVVLVFGRNLPFSSRCMTLISVVNVRLSRGRQIKMK